MRRLALSGLTLLFLLFAVSNCTSSTCKADEDCTQGKYCQEGQCQAPCKDGNDCFLGQACVKSRCQKPSSDGGPKQEKVVEVVPEKPADRGAPDTKPTPDNVTPDTKKPLPKCKFVAEKPLEFRYPAGSIRKRHDLVDNFTVKLMDGSTWTLKDKWTGCDTYLFIPETILTSRLSSAVSIWTKDLDQLVARSPKNVHYFFIGRGRNVAKSNVLKDMQGRVEKLLAGMKPADREHWKERLHVIATPASELQNWLNYVSIAGIGVLGFGIDRFQRLRGVGSLADVTRYNQALQNAKQWPFESNMAYVANEAIYYNYEAKRQARLDAEKVVEVKFWKGEVIKEFADMEVTLPSADEMKKFDTLELDVTQRCPSEIVPEFNNCGAWDYLSHFYLLDKDGKKLELARGITTYHREGRWIMDISPMLVRLAKGGKMKFRWLWAPKWNKQPTATWLSLRFSNRNKGVRPVKLVPLFTGGKFDEKYNENRKPMTVSIPATAKKVGLWALISGHGNSNTKCAEFCNHQHQFTVNGKTYLQQYPKVSDSQDCMKKVAEGVVPNQWGTWWLGRGGWCPGQGVKPYSVDLTQIAPAGKDAVISYKGLFQNSEPPKQTKTGNINLQSYLVIYE